ncbi:MAG: MotA/TolQ/ExbB proton channel family protein [Desulfobacteraceae bacterium]
MFEGKTIWEVISMGGFTMYILMICSIVSLGIFIERLTSYRRRAIDRIAFMEHIKTFFNNKDIPSAITYCKTIDAPISAVVLSALERNGHDERIISKAADREIMMETAKLERYTSIVGTIGNISVYIGLFGTVLGIVRSFHNMAQIGAGGISVVIGGVAEALICTAAGLSVAIPAVVAYNYFTRRVDDIVMDMEYCSSEVTDLLTLGKSL